MSELSTFEQANTAISRLDLAFGGEDVTEVQRFRELRLFRNAKPAHIEAIVDRAIRYFVRRPNSDELAQLLEDERQGRHANEGQVTPRDQIRSHVDVLRRRLAGDEVVIRFRTETALSASVRDEAGGGVRDVTFSDGVYSCTCPDGPHCAHVSAVKQTLGAVAPHAAHLGSQQDRIVGRGVVAAP